MIDFRKLLVALVIAVLFAIFVNTSIEAISPSPQYNQFCNDIISGPYPKQVNPSAPTPAEQAQLDDYNAKQKKCNDDLQTAQEKHNFVVFLVSAITGLIAVVIGLYVSVSSPVGMSIASGFILGGLFTIFFGTIGGWGSIQLQVRPLVIFLELAVVIWVAYKQLNGTSPSSTSSSKKRK